MRPDAMPSECPFARWFQTRTAKSVLCQIRPVLSLFELQFVESIVCRALSSDSVYTCNVKSDLLYLVCACHSVVALTSGSVDACKSMHIMNIIMLIWVLNMPTDSVYFFIIESRWLAVYAGIRINELHVWIGIFAGTARSKYWICRQTLDTFLFLDLDHSL